VSTPGTTETLYSYDITGRPKTIPRYAASTIGSSAVAVAAAVGVAAGAVTGRATVVAVGARLPYRTRSIAPPPVMATPLCRIGFGIRTSSQRTAAHRSGQRRVKVAASGPHARPRRSPVGGLPTRKPTVSSLQDYGSVQRTSVRGRRTCRSTMTASRHRVTGYPHQCREVTRAARSIHLTNRQTCRQVFRTRVSGHAALRKRYPGQTAALA
jgi:hypothetical protein